MRAAQTKLLKLLQADRITAGMYVRVHGDHLIAGRRESWGTNPTPQDNDRVRFTRLGANHYGFSVKRPYRPLAENPFLRNTRANC